MSTSPIDPNTIDPSTLGPDAIGQGIRVAWRGGVGGSMAIVQGVLARITHDGGGTDLVVDIGVDSLVLTATDLASAEVERV